MNSLNRDYKGVYFVDEFDERFEGHRFCEVEEDVEYHKKPISERTWFIHEHSPYYSDPAAAPPGFSGSSFFDQVNSILIPAKDGKSTEDQIKEVGGNLAAIHPAYESVDTMTAALGKLAQDDPKYQLIPIIYARVMHPKGAGYAEMANAVIDKVLKYGAIGAETSPPEAPAQAIPETPEGCYEKCYNAECMNPDMFW